MGEKLAETELCLGINLANGTVSRAKKGDRALDICCGSGDLTCLVSEKVGVDGQVIGLDFSEELLSVASSRQQLKLSPCYRNIEWLEADALDLPFPNASFDTITMGYGLWNVQDRKRALEEIFRVLKPGCRASILDFNKSSEPISGLVQLDRGFSYTYKSSVHIHAQACYFPVGRN
ncbi:2-phytyl-1,4-beta-naphthoquinone methyltransferase, chloroplastic-like isoform X1 [Silene latifolia]